MDALLGNSEEKLQEIQQRADKIIRKNKTSSVASPIPNVNTAVDRDSSQQIAARLKESFQSNTKKTVSAKGTNEKSAVKNKRSKLKSRK